MIEPGDDLATLMMDALSRAEISLEDGDIFVLAQKIVSKAEGRLVTLADVEPSPEAVELANTVEKSPELVELILRESRSVIRQRLGLLIVEHNLGFISANAGIDASNVEKGNSSGQVLLLPENPDLSARRIRDAVQTALDVQIGVLIIDSHGRAWRNGTSGVAIGLAGMPGLVDLRGESDLFGYTLRITMVGAADELAAGASLIMGQAAEGTPVVHVRGFPYPLREGSLDELLRDPEHDLFR
jgi:coenzyme F420-0:L-glutamate ligase/coenzyme F420-1:gamma-L-glutamate ligase